MLLNISNLFIIKLIFYKNIILIYFIYFLDCLQLNLFSIKGVNIKNTYIKNIYIKNTYIKYTYIRSIYIKEFYINSVDIIKSLKIYL